MKAFRNKLNPKNIRDAVRRRGSHHHKDDSDDDAASAHSDDVRSSGAATPRSMSSAAPSGMYSGGGSGTTPPNFPPGVKFMSGPPPPGAHVMKMPPGSRSMSPGGSVSPPPGAKMMSGPPPPGAKMMNGPPPGAKMMSGPPPPGAKIMSGPPPAGAKMMSGPPPPGAKIMNGPPPGAKIMSGPPPPGARLVPSPSLSRPGSPEARPGSRSPELQHATGPPPGAKIISGPPPPGARLIKSPPAGGFPGSAVSPPASPPLKLMIQSSSRPPSPGQSAPSTPQLNGLSFARSPPSPGTLSPLPSQGVLKPTPTPPKPAVAGPAPAVPKRKQTDALQIPRPSSVDRHNEESIVLMPGSSDSDIAFEDDGASPAAPVAATKSAAGPPPKEAPASSSSSSSTPSSSMFQEEPDLATALPAPRSAGSRRSGMSKNSSVHSSEVKVALSTHGSSHARKEKPGKSEKKDTPAANDKTTSKKKKKSKSSVSTTSSPAPERVETDRDESRPRTPSKRVSSHASSMASPAEVDRTKRRTPQVSPSVASTAMDGVEPARAIPLSALHTEPLTPALRTKIADQFLSILCPQQYFGKVKKIASIRPIHSDRGHVQGLKTNNSIYVATKGETPNPCFYPQLRLVPGDAVMTSSSSSTVSTPVILYEAAPGRMLFADTELEARRVLGTNATANSCFVLSTSSILFRDPAQYVLPVATLMVEWTPYASAGSEPQCPIHKRELQLFDPYSKELVCALCASKTNDTTASRLVVIPDVLSGDSRARIQTTLTKQLDEAQRSAKLFVGQHQRIAQMQESKKTAVSQQFDMLIAAIESKRQEYLEACDAEFGYALNDVAREILVADEKVQLLAAASEHLRSDTMSRPIYSMQIATVAEALAANRTFPAPFAKGSLKVPAVTSGVMPNLEGVMAELQALNPTVYTAGAKSYVTPARRAQASSTSRAAATSPRRVARAAPAASTSAGRARSAGASPRATTSPRRAQLSPSNPRRMQTPSNGLVRSPRRAPPSPSPSQTMLTESLSPTGRRRLSNQPRETPGYVVHRNDPALDTDVRDVSLDGAADHAGSGVLSVPNSSGTSLFDFPLQDLLVMEEQEEGCRPRCVQWSFRVEDPGDWVGIGVGVGSTIDAWERSSRNDLSHLWIVPYAGRRQTFLLRVTVSSAAGHAKLTIHDTRGHQLDDGAIPQWNASRVSYPQVTFGGRVGRVRLLDAPNFV